MCTVRSRLPDDRHSITRQFTIKGAGPSGADAKIYATVGLYDDGNPGELFLHIDKLGSLAHGAFDAVAVAISIGLQYGVPLEVFARKLAATRFGPSGFTGDPEFPSCTSILDLVARWLLARVVPRDDESQV